MVLLLEFEVRILLDEEYERLCLETEGCIRYIKKILCGDKMKKWNKRIKLRYE